MEWWERLGTWSPIDWPEVPVQSESVKPKKRQKFPWHLQNRGEWIAAWALVSTLAFGGCMALWIANATPHVRVPLWPVWLFAAGALVSLYMVFAPVFHWRPFRRPRDPSRIIEGIVFRQTMVSMYLRSFTLDERLAAQTTTASEKQRLEASADGYADKLTSSVARLKDEVEKHLGLTARVAMMGHRSVLQREIPPEIRPKHAYIWWDATCALEWAQSRVVQLQAVIML